MRTGKPIPHYCSILGWMCDILNNKENKEINLNKLNQEFIEHVRQDEIYNYNDSKIKSRFQFISGHLKKWGFLKHNPISLNIDKEIFFSNKTCKEDIFLKKMYLNWNEFSSMINFIIDQELDYKINIKKLRWAFSVFDYKKDSFNNLYEMDENHILEEIWKQEKIQTVKKIFRKPPKELKLLEKISELIQNNKRLDENTWKKYYLTIKKFKYINLLLKIRKKWKNINYVNLINNYIDNHTNKEFLKDIKFLSIKENIDKEYEDMFSR